LFLTNLLEGGKTGRNLLGPLQKRISLYYNVDACLNITLMTTTLTMHSKYDVIMMTSLLATAQKSKTARSKVEGEGYTWHLNLKVIFTV
jgi:hypothetical protein